MKFSITPVRFGSIGDLALELRKALTAIAAGWNVDHLPDGTHKIPLPAPGDSGDVLTSVGGEWSSEAPPSSAGIHAATHSNGSTDPVTVTNLAGYPGGTTTFLRADGAFAAPPGGGGGAHATTHQPGGADPMAVDAVAATGSLRTLGTGAQQAASGTDSRFTNARTPTTHATTHQPGGSDAMAVDAAAATGSLRTLGTTSTSAAAGNDARFTDARPPTAHKTTHEPGGSDALTVNAAAAIGSLRTLSTTATSACAGNDARLSDARTPTVHAPTHKSGGSDAIKLDELAAPTDITTLNATTAAHGLLRKLSAVSTQFLNGDGNWVTLAGGGGGIGDVVGPAGAVHGNVATFNGTTGKIISDSSLSASRLVLGPGAAVVSNNLARWNGTTGVDVADSNIPLAQVARLDTTNVFVNEATFSSAAPTINYIETDQPANQKIWRTLVNGQTYQIIPADDAYAGTAQLALARTGNILVGGSITERGRTTPMGEWIDVAFSAGNYTVPSGTWTVAAGHVVTHAYTLIGKTLHLSLVLSGTTVTGTPIGLTVALPAGFTSARTAISTFNFQDAAGIGVGYVSIGGGGATLMNFYKNIAASPTWSAGTTYIHGQITIAVT